MKKLFRSQIESIIITSIQSTAISKPTIDGYYIFTTTPSDGLPLNVNLNDIAKLENGVWYNIFPYLQAESSVQVGLINPITYIKDGNNGWISYVKGSQDAVGNILIDTNTIDLNYSNSQISAIVKDNSIANINIASNADISTSKIKQTIITPQVAEFSNNDTQDVLNNKTQGQINDLQNQINTRPTGASNGNVYYLTSQLSTIPDYELLSFSPDPGSLDIETVTINSSTLKVNRLIHSYISNYEVGANIINGGSWIFNLYGYVSHLNSSKFEIDVLKRDNTAETLLFTIETTDLLQTTQITPDLNITSAETVQQDFNCNITDKVVIKIYGKTDRAQDTVITLLHSGTEYASHVHTPLVTLHNNLIGLQGGSSTERYHLTQTEYNNVQSLTANLALKQDKTDNTLNTTSKTVVGAINELRTGKNVKTWYVSGGVNGSGSDLNNGYKPDNAFSTLSKLNTVLGNTGEQAVLLPSQLTESATFIQQNIEITGQHASHRGVCGTTGTITSNHPASSQTYAYFSCGTFVKQGSAYVILKDLSITNGFSDSGSGIVDAYNLTFNAATPISITGSGIKNFYNQRGGVFTINNATAQVNVVTNDFISQFVLTSGLLALTNCIVYIAQGSTFTIGTSGSFFIAQNVKFLYPDNTKAKINIPTGVNYSLQDNCIYDITNSTLNGTDISSLYTGYYSNIAIKSANLVSANPSNLLATDGNKNIQSLSTSIYPSLTEIGYVKGVTSSIQTQLNSKEPAFTKNTAFNKNFGNTSGTVTEGNDVRLGTKAIDETNIANNRIQVYNSTSGKLEYQDKPVGSTNLSIINKTSTSLDIASDTGNDATILSASVTEAGLLSASDKIKLNAISGTNTGDETTGTIYTKIKNNIVAGTNVTINTNDTNNTITINSSGGGGGTYDATFEYSVADMNGWKTLHSNLGDVLLAENSEMILFE